MAAWRKARAIDQLLAQVNANDPSRDKRADGTIGDASHANRESDHNPWVKDSDGTPVVTAVDITHDPPKTSMDTIVASIVRSRDRRIKYIIWAGRIISSTNSPWQWRPYRGTSPHDHHAHFSFLAQQRYYDSKAAFATKQRITHWPGIRMKDWRFARWHLGIKEYSRFGPSSKDHRPKDYPRIVPTRGWRAVRWYKKHLLQV